jgi:hypothetical protein
MTSKSSGSGLFWRNCLATFSKGTGRYQAMPMASSASLFSLKAYVTGPPRASSAISLLSIPNSLNTFSTGGGSAKAGLPCNVKLAANSHATTA